MTTKQFKEKYGITFSTAMSAKMSGMVALTTSCACNERCKRNATIKGSICEKCYANKYLGIRPSVAACYERNYNALKGPLNANTNGG